MGLKFIFSGAIAANVYRTIPRATMDIDVAIPFQKHVLEEIKSTFKKFEIEDWELLQSRLNIKERYPDLIVPEFLRLKHTSGYEIDLFPLYSNFLLRKRKAKVNDLEIDIIGPEDLIIIKSFFNRHKDLDDITNILENMNLALDLKYLITELEELENDEMIALIKKIR